MINNNKIHHYKKQKYKNKTKNEFNNKIRKQ